MLVLIVIMTFASMAFEIFMVTKFPLVRKLLETKAWVSLLFSLVLSLALGTVFGAAGLIVFAAGIMSTLFMQPVYALMRAGKWNSMVGLVDNIKSAIKAKQDIIISRIMNVYAIFVLVVKIVWLPIKILLDVIDMFGRICNKVVNR